MCVTAVKTQPQQQLTQARQADNCQGVRTQLTNSLSNCSCGGCGRSQCPCCGGGQQAGGNVQNGGKAHAPGGAHACSVGMQGCDAVHCKYADDGSPVTPGASWNQQGGQNCGPGGNVQTGGQKGGGAHACNVGMQGCDAVHCKYANDGSPVTPGAAWNQQGGQSGGGMSCSAAMMGGGQESPFGGSQGGGRQGQDPMSQLMMLIMSMLSGGNSFGGGNFGGSPFGGLNQGLF